MSERIDTSPEFTVLLTADGTVLALGGTGLAIAGIDASGLPTQARIETLAPFNRLPSADRNALTAALARARRGTSSEWPLTFTGIDDQLQTTLRLEPLQTADGGTWLLLTGRITVVAARTPAEFFDLSFDLMALADRDLRLIRVNRQWQETLLCKPSTFLGRRLPDLVHPDDAATAVEALQRLHADVPVEFEARIRRDDGVYRVVTWEVNVVGDERRIVGRDVTRRRLLEGYLPQVQKLEAIGEIAGGVAHDLNNVLMAVLGFGDIALGKLKPGDPLHEDVTMMVGGARRAQGVVRQLLTFARRQPVVARNIDINDICRDLYRLLSPMLGRTITTALDLCSAPCPVFLDPGQVDQMLLNLATNARDAMPNGGRFTLRTSHVTLDDTFVRAHPGARPGPHIRLDVEDTGSGMAPDVLSHVFEPFFTTKPAGRGTGLGLPMVYGAVKQAGGYIEVVSAPGAGSRFSLYFPRPQAAADSASERQRTVLLIEPDPDLQRLIGRMFDASPFRLVTSPSMPVARDVLAHGPAPDAVIADMPPQHEGEAQDETLEDFAPDRPLILLTDTVTTVAPRASQALILQKPFTREQLFATLERLLA